MKKILFCIVILIFLISCGADPPYITSASYSVLIYQQNSVQNMLSDNVYLSVFCVIAGDTEDHNLREMKITHLATEYSWTIEEKNLSMYNYHDTVYTGFPFIEYEDGKSLLLGDYLIEITDKQDNLSDFVIDVTIPAKKEGIFHIDGYIVPYKASFIRGNKELQIECKSNAAYSSAEIMFLNNQSIFAGGRRKYDAGERILFDPSYGIDTNTRLSVRLNTGADDNIIYYLTPVTADAVSNDDEHSYNEDATDDVTSDIITKTKGLFDRVKDGLFKKN